MIISDLEKLTNDELIELKQFYASQLITAMNNNKNTAQDYLMQKVLFYNRYMFYSLNENQLRIQYEK